jgi:hypothetical protein
LPARIVPIPYPCPNEIYEARERVERGGYGYSDLVMAE